MFLCARFRKIAFSAFPTMFSTLPKTYFNFSVTVMCCGLQMLLIWTCLEFFGKDLNRFSIHLLLCMANRCNVDELPLIKKNGFYLLLLTEINCKLSS